MLDRPGDGVQEYRQQHDEHGAHEQAEDAHPMITIKDPEQEVQVERLRLDGAEVDRVQSAATRSRTS